MEENAQANRVFRMAKNQGIKQEALAPGYVAFFITIRLVQTMVLRRVISLADAQELVDTALLDAENLLGDSAVGQSVREHLAALLKDLRNTPDS